MKRILSILLTVVVFQPVVSPVLVATNYNCDGFSTLEECNECVGSIIDEPQEVSCTNQAEGVCCYACEEEDEAKYYLYGTPEAHGCPVSGFVWERGMQKSIIQSK